MCRPGVRGDSGDMSIITAVAAIVAIAMVIAMAVAPLVAEAL